MAQVAQNSNAFGRVEYIYFKINFFANRYCLEIYKYLYPVHGLYISVYYSFECTLYSFNECRHLFNGENMFFLEKTRDFCVLIRIEHFALYSSVLSYSVHPR